MVRIFRYSRMAFKANKNGAMIAIMVPAGIAERISIPGGEPPDDLHITLFYFGDSPDIQNSQREKIVYSAIGIINSIIPFEISLYDTDVFNEDDDRPLYAKVRSTPLISLRNDMARAFDRDGIEYSKDHEFQPHITLKYLKDDRQPELTIDESFIVNSVDAVFGPEHIRLQIERQLYARKPGGIKQRFAPGEWERMTNRQQRRLTKTYDEWSARTRRALRKLALSGGTIQEQNRLFERALRELEIRLKEVYDRGIDIAKNVSAGSRSEIPELLDLAEKKKIEGNMVIASSLISAISAKIIAGLAKGVATSSKALSDVFISARSLPPQFAGGAWVMIFDTQKTLGKKREKERRDDGKEPERIRWVLDPLAEHCEHSAGYYGCPELAGEYPNWDSLPTVPAGQVTCRGNCRCHLEVYRDGKWRRGVYDD